MVEASEHKPSPSKVGAASCPYGRVAWCISPSGALTVCSIDEDGYVALTLDDPAAWVRANPPAES